MKWVLTLYLFLLAAPALADSDVEERCNDIDLEPGGTCVCSETLDGTGFATSGNNLNPDASTTKECSPNSSGYSIADGGHWSQVAEADMPGGNTVTTVWRRGPTGDGSGNPSRLVITPYPTGVERACHRVYFKLTNDYTGVGCGTKFLETKIRNRGTMHNSNRGADNNWLRRITKMTQADTINEAFDVSYCQGQWCRVEACVSSPTLDAGTDVVTLTVITSLNGTNVATFGPTNSGDVDTPSGTGVTFSWTPNSFRQPTSGTCLGSVDFSHAMAATWTSDQGQMIGVAEEIEGSGAESWNVGSVTLTPTSCVDGGSCDDPTIVDLSASASGSPSGNITWDYCCDVDTATPSTCELGSWTNIVACDDTGTSSTCGGFDADDLCNMSAETVGTYDIGMRSTNDGPTPDITSYEWSTFEVIGKSVTCSVDPSTVDTDAIFDLTTTPVNFTGDTGAYTFDCDDDTVLASCATEGGTLGTCIPSSCICQCPAIPTAGAKTPGCGGDEDPSTGPYTSDTNLTVNEAAGTIFTEDCADDPTEWTDISEGTSSWTASGGVCIPDIQSAFDNASMVQGPLKGPVEFCKWEVRSNVGVAGNQAHGCEFRHQGDGTHYGILFNQGTSNWPVERRDSNHTFLEVSSGNGDGDCDALNFVAATIGDWRAITLEGADSSTHVEWWDCASDSGNNPGSPAWVAACGSQPVCDLDAQFTTYIDAMGDCGPVSRPAGLEDEPTFVNFTCGDVPTEPKAQATGASVTGGGYVP